MKTMAHRSIALAAFGALLLASAPAVAGRGGSASRIVNAIHTGSSDAIIAELERAERLVCAACIEPVMALLDDERYEVREAAAWWFARRPAQKRELTERSLAYLQGQDAQKARNAADILGTFRHPEAVAPLAAALSRKGLAPEARQHLVRALGTIGHPAARPAIAAALGDDAADVRLEAAGAWLALREQTEAAALVPLVSDGDLRVRRKAIAVLGNLREGAARTALEAQLAADSDPAVRRNAAWALGRIGDAASRRALEAASADTSPLVARTARVALGLLR